MLVPPPSPAYTLAPGLSLSTDQQAVLEACLSSLTGRMSGVLVTDASTTAHHHLIELVTPAGRLLAIERVSSVTEALGALVL
jgi:hypothetical protein